MKLTFAVKTFAAICFRCSTLAGSAGSVVIKLYRMAEAQAACTGSAAGENFLAGATIGQDHHVGTTAGQCNG